MDPPIEQVEAALCAGFVTDVVAMVREGLPPIAASIPLLRKRGDSASASTSKNKMS